MNNFAEMGKVELRAACKEAGIKNYSKMNNDGMRAALTAHYAPVEQPRKTEDRHTGSGLKIEKNRETRNDVTRPSAGGKCRLIWDALDAYQSEEGEVPTVAIAKAIAQDEGWNVSNAAIEFYRWRKFNGITGRQ